MGDYGDAFSAAIAAELRAQRARVQVTFDALADKTGLAKTTVMNYLNGRREIPVPAFTELCRALGANPHVLFDAAQKAVEKH